MDRAARFWLWLIPAICMLIAYEIGRGVGVASALEAWRDSIDERYRAGEFRG